MNARMSGSRRASRLRPNREGAQHSTRPGSVRVRGLDLQEIVAADPLLGAPAMAALARMAERLVERRALTVAWAMPDGWLSEHPGLRPDQLVRRLISQQVLSEPCPGTLSFSHQTLLDCLAVYGALARGETLLEFIRSKLPVPFIRPTVRVFFFYLRAQDPLDCGRSHHHISLREVRVLFTPKSCTCVRTVDRFGRGTGREAREAGVEVRT